MVKSTHYTHGGNIDEIERIYKINKNKLIDFSANINPLGISPMAKEAILSNIEVITTYPDAEYLSLRESISQYTGAQIKDILVGNGSTELISNFIHLVSPKNAFILGPTYSEYEREINLHGGISFYYPLKEDLNFQLDIENFLLEFTNKYDLLVICNPNNPTGTALYQKDLLFILEQAKKNNTFVLIDETYIEFSPNSSIISSIPLVQNFDNLFVIRGISKFFSAPGLRLGYGICSNEQLKTKINNSKDPWSINSIANYVGGKMFKDHSYIQQTCQLIHKERQYFYNELRNMRFIKIYETESNFILCKLLKKDLFSSEVFETLLKYNMIIRDASSFPFLDSSFIRFCFMKHEDNVRLITELKKLL